MKEEINPVRESTEISLKKWYDKANKTLIHKIDKLLMEKCKANPGLNPITFTLSELGYQANPPKFEETLYFYYTYGRCTKHSCLDCKWQNDCFPNGDVLTDDPSQYGWNYNQITQTFSYKYKS